MTHSPGRYRLAACAPAPTANGHCSGFHEPPYPATPTSRRKQRVTITLPQDLLERLRNAVYWTGHGTLARLIADSLDDAVAQMEQANGGTFPVRLAPLKRGRPRIPPPPLPSPIPDKK